MIVLGLTGSIGMGKTTIGSMMKTLGIPVHESDHAVHELLQPKSKARPAIAAAFPYFEYPDIYEGKTKDLNREKFGDLVFNNDDHMKTLESILHPLVRESQNDFIRAQKRAGMKMVCLDIPLLFETGAERRVDHTITASAPAFIQRQRVLSRHNFTEEKFNLVLARQMPDGEKRARADYVINTGLNRAQTMQELKNVLEDIKKKAYPDQE